MSAPGTPGKQAAKGHHFFSASPSSALPSTTSASTSSTVASSSHYQVHRSANRPPTPKSSFRSTPVYSQLQNLHYDYVSSSSVSSASSFVDVDDGDGDISLAGPRPRLDRVLSSSQGTQSPSSLSQSGNQQRVLSLAVPTRPGQTSSAPSSPLAKRAPEPSRLASSLGRSASSSLGPAAGEQVISLDSLVAGNRAGGVPQTPPRLPGSKASDTPPSLSSQHRLDRLASRSLSVSIPNPRRYYLDVPERDGHQDLADDELSATAVRAPPLVDEKTARRMDRWVKEIVVCNFDLERGPVVERRAVGRRWGPGLKANVAFSSFPDTSLFTEGSIQFSFKIRDVPPSPASLAFPEPPSPQPDRTGGPVLKHNRGHSLSRERAAEYRVWDERGREWLYGYVWFQQKKDKSISRGYMQKSVVVLTQHPLPALFHAVLSRLAPSFFQHGYPAIEVACHSIASWPDPEPDALLELPLMSDVLTVKMPDKTENPQLAIPGQQLILAGLPASTPLRAFASFLPSLWSIWECMVLAEPLLVIAPDPETCSEIVWWLRELVRPLPLAGDFRPYLHIHDSDFSLLVNANKPQAGVVVGVTNPFFRNAASHWPNVISVTGAKPKTPGTGKVAEPEGFLSRRNRSVSKDRPLLKRLEALVAAGRLDDPAGNAALRTYFQQMTERMLVPLNRYFQTLVPPRSPLPSTPLSTTEVPTVGLSQLALQHPRPQRSNTPFSPLVLNGNLTPVLPGSPALQTLKPFSLPTFLQHLKTLGPNPLLFKTRGISSKSRVESDFYASFCKSSMFAGWLSARVESLGLAVASNMLEDAVAAAAAVRISPDPYLLRLSERSSTEATTTASSATASNASLSPTSDNDDAETPRPKDGPRDPFAGRQLEESVRETMTPTRTRPHPSPYGNSSQGPLSAQ